MNWGYSDTEITPVKCLEIFGSKVAENWEILGYAYLSIIYEMFFDLQQTCQQKFNGVISGFTHLFVGRPKVHKKKEGEGVGENHQNYNTTATSSVLT